MTAAVAVILDTALFSQLAVTENLGGLLFGTTVPDSVAVAAGAVMALPLIWRRSRPALICWIVAAYSAVLVLSIGSRPIIGPVVALFTAAAWTSSRTAYACLAATLTAHGVQALYEANVVARGAFAVFAVTSVFVLLDVPAWALGRRVANARAHARELVASRESLAEEAIALERLRIARELHDIVAHAVTVMVLQATVARLNLQRDPGRAELALTEIEGTGAQAVTELSRMLTVLRTVGDATERADLGPGLNDLPALSRRIEAAGIGVTVSVNGQPGRLDPSVDLSAYRIVQEALTNTTRYAGPGATANVKVTWRPDGLEIEVVDDGAGDGAEDLAALSSGFGFAGLRERISLIGGRIAIGPRVDSAGYRIAALLPVNSNTGEPGTWTTASLKA